MYESKTDYKKIKLLADNMEKNKTTSIVELLTKIQLEKIDMMIEDMKDVYNIWHQYHEHASHIADNHPEYYVKRYINGGSFGSVYLALKKSSRRFKLLSCFLEKKLEDKSDQSVAIKVTDTNIFYNEYYREISHLQIFSIDSLIEVEKNIVKILKYSMNHRRSHYSSIVLEFVQSTLYIDDERVSRDEKYTPSQLKDIAKQIINAVDQCHSRGIAHLDVKPMNIGINSLEGKKTVKLLDFGSSTSVNIDANRTTRWYSSPESILSNNISKLNIKTLMTFDIWSVGCVLLEMICKSPAFPGGSSAQVVQLIYSKLGVPTPEEKVRLQYRKHEYISLKSPTLFTKELDKAREEKRDDIILLIDLISKMLIYDTNNRITSKNALLHPYFGAPPAPSSVDQQTTN